MNLYSLLNRFFEHQIRLVYRWPLLFIAIPLAITASLVAVGLQNGKLVEGAGGQSLDIFLPDSMQSLKELKELLRLFPPQDALRDSYSLFGSSFAYAIFEDAKDGGNILEPKMLNKVAALHKMISRNIRTKNGLHFGDVCFREEPNSTCTQHPIMVALEDGQASVAIRLLARYPTLRLSGGVSVDNAVVFGGVQLSTSRVDRHGNAAIERASAIRLLYVLENSDSAVQWIGAFIEKMSTLKVNNGNDGEGGDGVALFYTSSLSLPEEMGRNGELLVPWMPWMVALLAAFCALCCAKPADPVGSQPLIGLGAMLNAFLAIMWYLSQRSAMATLIYYIDYPFMHMIMIMPFLILSIGVDNMFLMLRTWRSLHDSTKSAAAELEGLIGHDRVFIEAISEVSVSIFVTSLTDGISFAIGTLSDFMAVRVFCTYCWLAILYMFLYQMTFLTALMALQCRREASNRHWLLCCVKVKPVVVQNVAGLNSGCWQIYRISAQIIQHRTTKWLTLLLYFLYLFCAAHWISTLQLGVDLKLLTPDGSFVAQELRAQERLFADFGGHGYCLIHTDDGQVALWEREERVKLMEFYANLTSGKYASKGDFWLDAFEASNYSEPLHLDMEREFMKAMAHFLGDPQFGKYRTDIRFNEVGRIEAMKMSFRIRKLGHANDAPRAEFLRSVMAQSGYRGFVYDMTFLLVDQQWVTRRNMVANILAAMGAMLAISALVVPRPRASLAVALTILSINIGVVGALSAVRTRLDIVSMITILMSIGLSFDYATHVTLHFLLFRQNRIENTLRAVAVPIGQAALSTLVGVAILAAIPSYMVRTFVHTVLFVVTIGLGHALFLLPVLLHFVVPTSEYLNTHSSQLNIRTLQQMAAPTNNYGQQINRRRRSIVYFY